MDGCKFVTVDEDEIRMIIAEKYGVCRTDVHLMHEDYEVAGFSGHAIPATKYVARVKISEKERGQL